MGKKVLVGMLLLGALFIFGVATFYVENWEVYLGKTYKLTARFPMANALDAGDLVRMAGVPVGAVANLTIDTSEDELPVHAELWIRSDVMVRAEDTAVVRISSIFGGNYISIERGDRAARELRDGEQITKTSVAPSMTEVIEQSQKTLVEVQSAFSNLEAITREVREGKGTLARLIRDEDLYDRVKSTVDNIAQASENLKDASDRLQAGQGALGKLLMDDALATKLDNIVASAADIASDLNEGKGFIGKLLKDEDLYPDLREAADGISEAARLFKDGDGLLPLLLRDTQVAEDARLLVADVRAVASDLREGKGTLGRLFAQEEAYEDLMGALTDIREATRAIAGEEGTLGLLIKDRELYDRLSALAGDLQAILEAYREQSPLITFAGSLLGAF